MNLQALDRCKDQEQKIEGLQGPLEQLRREAQTDFDRVWNRIIFIVQIRLFSVLMGYYFQGYIVQLFNQFRLFFSEKKIFKVAGHSHNRSKLGPLKGV